MDKKAENAINKSNILESHLAKINQIYGSQFNFGNKHLSDADAPQGPQ